MAPQDIRWQQRFANYKRAIDMIADRNEITHTYDEKTAGQIFLAISERYFPLLLDFQIQMEEIASSQSTQFE